MQTFWLFQIKGSNLCINKVQKWGAQKAVLQQACSVHLWQLHVIAWLKDLCQDTEVWWACLKSVFTLVTLLYWCFYVSNFQVIFVNTTFDLVVCVIISWWFIFIAVKNEVCVQNEKDFCHAPLIFTFKLEVNNFLPKKNPKKSGPNKENAVLLASEFYLKEMSKNVNKIAGNRK